MSDADSRMWILKTVVAIAGIGAVICCLRGPVAAQRMPAAASAESAMRSGIGRLYIFRGIRSFGAHIDDDITIDGVPVHRLTAGTGFYCDVKSGNHVIGVMQHEGNVLAVQVNAGQSEYVLVSLRETGGTAMRGGAITSDQPFVIRLLEPENGATRIKEYRMLHGACPLP